MSNLYELHILDFDDNMVETMEFEDERQAEKAERGIWINLDHSNYYTEIVEKK